MPVCYFAHQPLDGRTGHEVGRALLRQLWQAHVATPMPEIIIAPGGKPCFREGKWHFSISHTPRNAFCVLSDCPVGLDAEEADRPIDLRLAKKILSAGEYECFSRAEDPRTALLSFWVLKEAEAKLTGLGLRGYPDQTDFRLPDSRIFRVGSCIAAIMQEQTVKKERESVIANR